MFTLWVRETLSQNAARRQFRKIWNCRASHLDVGSRRANEAENPHLYDATERERLPRREEEKKKKTARGETERDENVRRRTSIHGGVRGRTLSTCLCRMLRRLLDPPPTFTAGCAKDGLADFVLLTYCSDKHSARRIDLCRGRAGGREDNETGNRDVRSWNTSKSWLSVDSLQIAR